MFQQETYHGMICRMGTAGSAQNKAKGERFLVGSRRTTQRIKRIRKGSFPIGADLRPGRRQAPPIHGHGKAMRRMVGARVVECGGVGPCGCPGPYVRAHGGKPRPYTGVGGRFVVW